MYSRGSSSHFFCYSAPVAELMGRMGVGGRGQGQGRKRAWPMVTPSQICHWLGPIVGPSSISSCIECQVS